MQDFAAQHGAQRFDDILDIGCSAGISTRALAEAFPEAASVAGLDLSPHFLAVAEFRERCGLHLSSIGRVQASVWPPPLWQSQGTGNTAAAPSCPRPPAACTLDCRAHTASAQLIQHS